MNGKGELLLYAGKGLTFRPSFRGVIQIIPFNLEGESPPLNIDIVMFIQNFRETPFKHRAQSVLIYEGFDLY